MQRPGWMTGAMLCTCLAASACGGGSSAGTPGPTPSLTLSASPTSVTAGNTAVLTWNASQVQGCEASGGWSGSRPSAGSETTQPLQSTSTFSLTCTGAGGAVSAAVDVEVIPGGAGNVFPLHTEAGKRHLLDANGAAFLIQGDTPWSLMVQLTREQADQYLEDRRARGFNAILVNLIEHEFADNPPRNIYGEAPFLTAGDFSTPNDRYFDHAAYVIGKARDMGIAVFLTPAYMGYQGGSEGWYQEMVANGATKLAAYGRYVGQRFRGFNNVVWVNGGDYNPPNLAILDAVADGIRDQQPDALQTFHGSRGTAALQFLGPTSTWLDVNDIYTNVSTVVSSASGEYARSTMPFFLIEALYENEGADERQVRLQAYQAVLSGACGQFMGNRPTWRFPLGWETALDSPGARTIGHLRALLDPLPWWTLVPDAAGSFLTSGLGSGADRAVAAVAADRSVAIVYVPALRDITLSLDALSGPRVRVRWFDPASGAYLSDSGSPFPASSSRTFRAPSSNSNGYGDWALVLESIS